MAGSCWWAAALVLACGCGTVRSIRVSPTQPITLTAAEARAAQVNGRKLYEQQPRSVKRVREAARQLTLAAEALREEYAAQWQAAEALAFLAEHEAANTNRLAAAKRGIVLARQAWELKPAGAEGHYWYAVNTGLLADVDRSYGMNAVTEMESALRKSLALAEKYDYAGATRLLGILHLRTPPPPVGIGSARKGLRLLQRATELFPDYPENQLYLGEALRENNRADEARSAWQKVVEAKPWPDRQFESTQWQQRAQQLLRGTQP